MKVSTAYLFDRATERMSNLQNQLSTTQAQMAVSKQILSPSDSPDKAAAIQRLKGEVQRQDSHTRTLEVALQRYTAEETALQSSNDLLLRLKELSIQAANDTLGPDDRKSIATEMRALRDQLVSLGNTRDDSGNYLFSGTRVNTPAFAQNAQGQVEYQGDQTQTRIPAGVERTVLFTRSGTDVFQRVVRDNGSSVGFFDALDQAIDAVQNSRTVKIQQGIADLDQTKIDLYLDDVHVAVKGGRHPNYQEADGQRVMKQSEITVRVVLGRGDATDTVWTCDLSHDYVSINADYRS